MGSLKTPLALAVVGHVNHGKTALVRALTGIETDRLKEEIERGLSITLGFAWRAYGTDVVDFIDAPGHEDFIRAMVMGAAGARAALLVVSATEGVGPQTREHLRIAGLLGLGAGIVAVTKADLISNADRPAIRQAIAQELAGSFLESEPLVFCSATTGAGIEQLQAALAALAARTPEPERLAGAWLPLDRVFTLTGAGTVATGTLQGAGLSVGDEAVLEPSGRQVKLRQIQVHGEAVEHTSPGGRVAVGLRGVSVDEIKAGEVLCAPGAFEASLLVDVDLGLSADSARPLKSLDEVRVMWGARQDIAKLRLIGRTALAPGERGLARLRFSSPVIAHAGQRAILRRPSPAETIGGILVLDPSPVRGGLEARSELLSAAAAQDLDQIATALALRDGGALCVAETARLARRTAFEVQEILAARFEPLDDSVMARSSAVGALRHAYLERVGEAHRQAPTRAWVPVNIVRATLAKTASRDLVAHVEKRLAAAGDIRLVGAQVALPGHDPLAALSATALARLGEIEQTFRNGAMTPPDSSAFADEADPVLVALLVETGHLVSLRNHALRQTVTFHAEALDAALATLRTAFPPPCEFTTGEARAALWTSRKFIVPALEYLDARGVTVREGDVRRLVLA